MKTLSVVIAFVVNEGVEYPYVPRPSESRNNAGLLVQHVACVMVGLRILVKHNFESMINKIRYGT